jgi:hypothetical protein
VGVRIRKGDRFAIPAGWLTVSFNPLKSRGQLSDAGLAWFAKHVIIEEWLGKRDQLEDAAAALQEQMHKIAMESPQLSALGDSASPESEAVQAVLSQIRDTREFWAYCTSMFLSLATAARHEHDSDTAVWATASAERCRMMFLFKEHLEDAVRMAQSARRLIDAIQIWDANRDNDDEGFWQHTLSEHSYVLAQVFAVPVVFIGERAYVGGTRIDGTEGKFVDYLLAAEASRETILVEIKTPKTPLVGSIYRKGVYKPAAELSGAIVQVLSYREELVRSLQAVNSASHVDLQAFRPRCVIVAGNASAELQDDARRRSFELFRTSSEVEIVSYDELFRKVEVLAELFSLKRTPKGA